MGKAAESGGPKLGTAAPEPRRSPQAQGGRPVLLPSRAACGARSSRSGEGSAAAPAAASGRRLGAGCPRGMVERSGARGLRR